MIKNHKIGPCDVVHGWVQLVGASCPYLEGVFGTLKGLRVARVLARLFRRYLTYIRICAKPCKTSCDIVQMGLHYSPILARNIPIQAHLFRGHFMVNTPVTPNGIKLARPLSMVTLGARRRKTRQRASSRVITYHTSHISHTS